MTAAARRVLVDLQGTQSADHRDRGVARYIMGMAAALQERHGEVVGPFLLNPDLTPPDGVEPFLAARSLSTIDAADVPPGGVYHAASPYELQVPVHRLWPDRYQRAGLRLVVTLYDVIPEVFAEHYLADPGLRRRYRARHHLVRSADVVLAISRATADDAVRTLGLEPARVTVVGGAVAEHFVPAADRRLAAETARRLVPGLDPRYVLYTGGIDHRKNIDGLVEAFARLPQPVRDRWQLVVVCSVDEPTRHHYEVMTERLGIGGRLLLTGFVAEHALVALYQGCDLFVFPSLYEGYGFPVAEAMACGAPTIASAGSSLDELTKPVARFDGRDPGAIAAALERGLTDDSFRETLRQAADAPAPRWGDVADRVAAVYDDVLALPPRPARRPRRRPRIAFVSPLPPQRSGVATYSARLLEHLREHVAADAFVDGPRREPPATDAYRVENLHAIEGATGGYDEVVYCIGNSEFHGGALAGLRRRSGIVLAHDVRLVNLYYHGAHRRGTVPEGFHGALRSMYDGRIPPSLGAAGNLSGDEADRYGLLMAREVIARSTRFLTMSRFAADLASLDAAPGDRDRIGVVPFGMRSPLSPDGTARDEKLVATFGVVHEIKQTSKLVQAMGDPALARCRLAVVGPASDAERARLRGLAGELELGERLVLTGEVDDGEYEQWLRRAAVAVQLRASTNGESSAAVGDCLAAGLPTVVTRLGAARELPDECTVKVAHDAAPADLAATIASLLDDGRRRQAMGAAAVAHAEAHGFDTAAAALADLVLGSPRP